MSKLVRINDREYDIVGVQNKASGEAWAELIRFNGWNPFKMNGFMAEHEVEDEAVGLRLLQGPLGGEFVEMFLSMVFLAMRTAGDRSPTDPGRPISPSEAFALTPLMPALGEFFRVGEELRREQAKQPGGDPTRTVRTVSDPDGNRAQRRAAAKRSKS